MASSSKEKAIWNSEDVETFCKLCIDQIDKGNRPGNNKRDGWTIIIVKFEELRGNPKFRAFRSRGIHLDLEVLLDRMFGDSVASGSVTWNPAQGLSVDEEVVATQLDIDDCVDSTDDVEGDIGGKSAEQVQSQKRGSQSSVKQSQPKKKKKMGPADKILEQLKEMVVAFNDKTMIKEFDPYEDIIETLTNILEIKENDQLYFFALELFAEKKDNRQISMNLRSNESRVGWIKYKFATKYNPQ